jgi:hypothetical protein
VCIYGLLTAKSCMFEHTPSSRVEIIRYIERNLLGWLAYHTHTLTHSQTHTLNQREKSIHSGREISEQYVALIHCIAFPHPSRISFKIKKEPASVSALKQGGIPSSRVMKATQKHLAQHSQNMFVNLARWQWRPWVLPNAHNTYNEEVFLPWGGLISINWNL